MSDEILRDKVSSLNKNETFKGHQATGNERIHELPRMYGSSDVAIADTQKAIVPADPSSSSANSSNESRRQNLTKNMKFLDDDNNNNNNMAADDDPSTYMSRLNKPKTYDYPTLPLKYDFQNLGTALPLVLMPTATVAAPAPVNPIPPPPSNYYTINDPNNWRPNYNVGETYPTQVPNSDYFVSNPDYSVADDYYYPIICGMRNDQQPAMNRWAMNPYMDTSNLGYAPPAPAPTPSPQPWVVPYNNGNYYTSLQPQNFYANVAPGVPPGIPPQFICKRDCTPTTRFPTTRCTRRPGSPQPVIAWENNNTCCCELCGIACRGAFNQGKGPRYGPCKPPPLPMPNNRNALYCHGRRRKREYYLSAPKARQRLQRESDRCRITTTTTPKPRAWPTNYPIKYKLQKSIDATNPYIQTHDTGIPGANQVSNVPMSPAAHQQLDKILIFENQHPNLRQHVSTSDKIQVVNENKPVKLRTRKVPETASSKLRKKHNETRMQELQETLEIALERMNQEMNQ